MTHVLRLILRSSWPRAAGLSRCAMQFFSAHLRGSGTRSREYRLLAGGSGVASAAGSAQNSVDAMLQTRDGYLWLGTKGGLSRFDGVRFTTFDDRDNTQLRESEVWALPRERMAASGSARTAGASAG